MREQAVPCRFASIYDARAGRHTTWNDDATCDRCARQVAAAAPARGRREGVDPTPTGSTPTNT